MIYTVTFNPAIDYVVQLEHLTQGTVNRTGDEAVYCGGKGINVSTVLTNLGIENVALGFLAGFTGDAVENALQRKGLRTDFIRLQNGMTRINVKIRGACETEINGTEINGKGPDIGPAALALLYKSWTPSRTATTLFWRAVFPRVCRAISMRRLWPRCRKRRCASQWMPRGIFC